MWQSDHIFHVIPVRNLVTVEHDHFGGLLCGIPPKRTMASKGSAGVER